MYVQIYILYLLSYTKGPKTAISKLVNDSMSFVFHFTSKVAEFNYLREVYNVGINFKSVSQNEG